ncbi:AAA family ATPase [Rhodobacteraceae bacterium DSL-40]|uniref:AAA family ATPase n=1 Tax=Amaricoccus sp. B4 TaxID=3368557 RepID=UPI000DAD87AF
MPENTRFHVITGGPGSGKSTLLARLADWGIAQSDEAGRAIIRDQSAIDGPALPWRDRALFAELMLSRELHSYRAAAASSGPVIFDRGIPDVIGYLRLEGLPVPPHLLRAAESFRYNARVFFAPHWPEIYRNDAERRQDPETARRTCEAMIAVYADCGYRIVELPCAPVEVRAEFICKALA